MNRSQHICLLAQYNADMNAKMYASASALPHEALVLDRKAFFGSILGTLNHLLVADLIWLKRFSSHPADYAALQEVKQLTIPHKLDDMLYPDLASLLMQRQRFDQIILAFSAAISEAALDEPLLYHTLDGSPMRKNTFSLLMHLFNHQTHHRGQVSTLLFQAGVDIGVTDLNAWVAQI